MGFGVGRKTVDPESMRKDGQDWLVGTGYVLVLGIQAQLVDAAGTDLEPGMAAAAEADVDRGVADVGAAAEGIPDPVIGRRLEQVVRSCLSRCQQKARRHVG